MERVGDDVGPRPAGVERVAAHARHRHEREREHPGRQPRTPVDQRDRRERPRDERDDQPRVQRRAEPRLPRAAVLERRPAADDEHAADADDDAHAPSRGLPPFSERRADGQSEERRPRRSQEPGEEDHAGDDAPRRRPRSGGGQDRDRCSAPGADPEREHADDRVPVVGEHAPEHGVVAVREVRAQGHQHDAAVAAGEPGLPRQHRAAAVPHHARSSERLDRVVEHEPDDCRRRLHDPARPRHRVDERGVGRGRRGRRERDEQRQ